MTEHADAEHCIAVLSPTGRDAELTHKVLMQAGVQSAGCTNIQTLCALVEQGVGALLVAEEALQPEAFDALARTLERQPKWSDIPVLVLTARGANSPTAARALETIGNVTLLERPMRVASFVSNARAALRDRQRQYQLRAHIAERQKAEEALRNADRRKDEFLATLAHELRNPLAPISNATRLLRSVPQEPSLRGAREVIERQVHHLARLVEDLLDVSRISRGKIELRRHPVDLASVVRNAVETSQPLITERAHELSLDLPPDPVLVDVDATRLGQVISNLLNNAAKYTPSGGRIVLSARIESGIVTIRVKDTGIGIDPSLLPTIFDMFVQADNRVERETGGLGIGLTLVRHFVDMHGGSVRAKSDGPNRGSEFVVTLPVADSGALAPPQSVAPEVSSRPPRGLRILVADDNLDNASTMSTLLHLLGNDVVAANSGAEALACAADWRPDVALLDLGMPVMNGYEVAQRIRDFPWGKHVLLVAITGWGQDADRHRSRAAGFDHHLVKPVEIDRLLALLSDKAAQAG